MMNKHNIKLYTIYHENKLYDEYNLFETDIVKPINIKNLIHDHNDPLIKYNKQLSEFATMYYIWKNNIKSDYIGFQHYRRAFIDYDINKLKKGNTLVRHKWMVYNFFTNRDEPNLNYRLNLTDSYLYYTIRFKEFIYTNYDKYYYNRLNRILFDNDFDKFKCVYGREMYITNWNVFSKIVKCIYNFLEYVFGKKLEYFDEFDTFQKFDQQLVFNNIDSNVSLAKNVFKRDKRYIACYIENLISLCIQLFSKEVNVCDQTSFSITLNYKGNENLLKWINKQYISGVSEIYVNNINNKKIYLNNYRYQDVNISNTQNNDNYHYNIIIDNEKYMSKTHILKLNNIFNKLDKNNIKSIKLNNNIEIINNYA